MLLRIALLALLPLVALGQESPMMSIMETMYKPCILRKINCPADGSLDLSKFEPTVVSLLKFRPPKQCKCDLGRESCVRKCYYAYMHKMYMLSAAAGKTSRDEIAQAKRKMREHLNTYYRPCILFNRDCHYTGLTLATMETNVRTYLSTYSLPEECECSPSRESCVRACYYSYLVRSVAGK